MILGGYDHTADPAFVLNFPSLFELGQDYEASFVMKGYDNIVVTEDDDIGSIGMQDIFDLENKYVCLGVKLQSPTQTVIRYGNQITYINYFVRKCCHPSDLIRLGREEQ